MIGVLLDMEAYMGMSLIEVLREMVFFTSTTKYYEITGDGCITKSIFIAVK